MEYLFIGGYHGGRRIEVSGPPSIPIRLQHITNPSPTTASGSYTVECYFPIPFLAARTDFTVYALDGLNAAQVLAALIAKYPQNVSGPQ